MIGIIPAAGQATRMMGIPKMLLPIGNSTLIDVLIERMQMVDTTGNPIIVSRGVIAEILEYHTGFMIHSAYTDTMSETVLSVNVRREQENVLFGMPDTYFDDDQAFVKLAKALDDHADVTVGLFRTRPGQHKKLGMCGFRDDQVTKVVDKPEYPILEWAWGVLAWKPVFWAHIKPEDPHVGYALPRAIEAGLDVRAVRMDGGYWDCGTPDEYFDCIDHLRSKPYEAGRDPTTAGAANPD